MTGFCPLDLVSGDQNAVERAMRHILYLPLSSSSTEPPSSSDATKLSHITNWALHFPLLQSLRDAQARLDTKGVFCSDVPDKDFLTAMTLRDCSVYLQVHMAGKGEVMAKLGDLDLKSAEKMEYWMRVEEPLIEEGWYAGTEEEGEEREAVDCALGREGKEEGE
jgi:inositol-pentakisphosphate 2-kinase